MADTYWGQNKGRSMEGALVKSTKFLAVLFIVLAAVLNLKVFADVYKRQAMQYAMRLKGGRILSRS